ncbi:MAG: LamG domain-containing protein [Myxococcales bacterium]
MQLGFRAIVLWSIVVAGCIALRNESADGSARETGGTSGRDAAIESSGGMTGAGGTRGVAGSGGARSIEATGGSATGGSTGTGGATGGGPSDGTAGNSATGGRAAGGTGIAGGGGIGGQTNCAGRALSLAANVPAGGDLAMARVVVDFGATGTDLPLDNRNRTIEFWAYMMTTSWMANNNTAFFYGANPSAGNADGFGLDFGAPLGATGTINPFTNGIFDNGNQSSGVMTTPAQWVHLAMTWDGISVRAFVNGVQKTFKAGSQATLRTGRSPLTIGGYPSVGAYFNGYIDEFRVWNISRSAAEITATMSQTLVGNEAGLTGYWKFDDAVGSTMAADSVTSAGHMAHPGVLTGAGPEMNPVFISPNPPAPLNCP